LRRKYIMGTYYRHTRSEKAEVPYSFQCERCGKESGLLRAVIVGSDANYNSNFKTLSPDREEKLSREAHGYLVRKMKKIHEDAVEKKIFSTDFHDECPFCHQPQSWAVSGLKKKMYDNPIACLVVGAIVAMIVLVGHYSGDIEFMTLPVAAGVFAVGVVAALCALVWNVIKIQKKTRKAASDVRRFPVIDWDAVRNLLNEE